MFTEKLKYNINIKIIVKITDSLLYLKFKNEKIVSVVLQGVKKVWQMQNTFLFGHSFNKINKW